MKRWRNWPLARKALVGIALPLLLMVLALTSLYVLEARTANAEAEARRTLTVQADIQSLHAHLAEAAGSVRGYLLTGREDFLPRYREAQNQLPALLKALDASLIYPDQRARLERIVPLITRKLNGLERLRNDGHRLGEPSLVDELVVHKRLLDALRNEIDDMREREQEIVRLSTANAQMARQRTRLFSAAAGVVGVLALVLSVWLFATDIIRRVQRVRDDAQRLALGQPLPPLAPDDDEIGQLAQRLHETSELLRLQASRIQQALAEAQQANAAKSGFLSRISHELRTPLNAIVGFSQLLLDSPVPETRRAAEQMLSGGRHLQQLIDDLLDLGRIESGREQLQVEALDVRKLVGEAIELGGMRDAAVRISVEPGCTARADRRRLQQVLINLISNALKYGPTSGPVEIVARRQEGRCHIEIRDQGPGIDPAQRNRLFQPFERLGAECRGTEGAGLGLAVSRQLAEAMEGTLELDSTYRSGCCFRVDLPGADAGDVSCHDHPPGFSARTAVDQGHRCRLLCVEDHPGNRALLQALLGRNPSVDVVMARTGSEAIGHARDFPPDAAILDLHLPDMDATALIDPLRQIRPSHRISILMLTADALADTRHRVLQAGADAYLTKPLDVAAFQAWLDGVITA